MSPFKCHRIRFYGSLLEDLYISSHIRNSTGNLFTMVRDKVSSQGIHFYSKKLHAKKSLPSRKLICSSYLDKHFPKKICLSTLSLEPRKSHLFFSFYLYILSLNEHFGVPQVTMTLVKSEYHLITSHKNAIMTLIECLPLKC